MSNTLVNFIQDRSGSMSSVWEETLSGFKKFVEDLQASAKADGVEYLFSLTVFDTLVETPIVAMPIGKVDTGVLSLHGPRGSTALYDAVGKTIQNTDADRHGADKIICVVVTDGQENSSREWKKDGLHAAVEAKLKAGDWTFTYLGTQPETWNDAAALGVQAGAVRSYTPTMAKQAYSTVSHAVCCLAKDSTRMASRSLMDDYVDDKVAAAAGMSTSRPVTSVNPPVKVSTPPASSTRRWR